MRIGDLIKKKRKEAGLTQDELAKRLDVTKSTLSKWESSRIHNMRRDNIVSLSNALCISPIDLLNAAEQKNEKKAVIDIDDEPVLGPMVNRDLCPTNDMALILNSGQPTYNGIRLTQDHIFAVRALLNGLTTGPTNKKGT